MVLQEAELNFKSVGAKARANFFVLITVCRSFPLSRCPEKDVCENKRRFWEGNLNVESFLSPASLQRS